MCVDTNIGKGWAKGLTATVDVRIARSAAAHRGMAYARRLPDGTDRRYKTTRTLSLEWSASMAYVVGLIATDGCLITGRTKINFKSADRDLVVTFLGLLGRTGPIKSTPTRSGGIVHFTEFGDAQFYRWLKTIGLMSRKSLLLRGVDVPDEFLTDLARGLLDGDGHIQNFVHHPTLRTYSTYSYERFWVFFNSASRPHLEWLQSRLAAVVGIRGRIETLPRPEPRHEFYRLKYGNGEGPMLMRAIYPAAAVPKLERKWSIWDSYERRRLSESEVCAEGGDLNPHALASAAP